MRIQVEPRNHLSAFRMFAEARESKRRGGREKSSDVAGGRYRRIGLLSAEPLERLAQQLIKGCAWKIYVDIEKFVEQARRHVARIAL